MGAHPGAPSSLDDEGGPTLDAVVADDPAWVLGAEVADRFEGRLPFLLKILAPVQALSIQVHPSLEQVGEAPTGAYPDGWPKPEAFCALTDFRVFAGTRPFTELQQTSAVLDVPELTDHVAAVAGEPDPIHAFIDRLVSLEGAAQQQLAEAVTTACRRHSADESLRAVVGVAQDHPGDIGLVVLLAMRYQVVRPGQYAFLPAGVLHAYVHGVAVEIMANSDNVVRAGLTHKRLDAAELLRILDTGPTVEPQSGQERAGWTEFDADTPYFRLRTAQLTDRSLAVPDGGPRIMLVLNGTATVQQGMDRLDLEPGQSCFLAAGDSDVAVSGDAQIFLASSP